MIAAIVADDFSSATDCGVQFSSRGLTTVALMTIPALADLPADDVISIDTDSRAASPEVAYGRVKHAAELVKRSRCRHIYKSIDSTLRGNLGVEIDAMLDVLQPDFAFVAPAFPHWGRTTLGGRHFLNGVPISESQFADDPIWPIREPDLVRLLATQTGRGVGLIDIEGVRGGASELAAQLARLAAAGKRIVVFDAQTEEDLSRIASLAASQEASSVIVGSTGLSQYLANAWGIAQCASPGTIGARRGPVILVSGSASPTTRRQIERFLDGSNTLDLPIEAASVLSGTFQGGAAARDGALASAIGAGQDIAIYLNSTPESVAATQGLGASRGLGKAEVSDIIVRALADLVAGLVAGGPVAGILLTGGDTAKAVCGRLGGSGMRLLTEVEPGVPVGLLVGPIAIPVITKAGAFGTDDVLNKARNVLRGAD